MECCPEKSLDNSSPVGGGSVDLTNVTTNNLTVLNQANIAGLTATGTTLLQDLTVTGTTNLADLNLTNIQCSTLEASTYIRAKNTSSDTVSLLMTPSTDPNPRRGVIRTASTAFGLDFETLGSNKAIRGNSDMITMSSLNAEGPAFVQIGSNTSSDRGKVKITANSDVELVSLLAEVNIAALSNISLESLGIGFITIQSALGGVITSAPFGNVGIYSGLTSLPSLLPGVTINSSTSLTLSSTLGTSITAGLLASAVTTPGDILIKATQTAGIGGAINIQALSTFPGISPPNAIALTTDVGVIALTSGAGGVAVTTGAGLVNIATGGGGIQLRTGVDVLLGSGGILLQTLIGGPIQLIAVTDAVSLAAPLGGVNIGTNSSSTVGQFTVFTSNNATGAATGNITMSTHGTGVLTGPGNIVIDGTQAYTGNMSLYSKGTLQITSNNTASGSVSNTTGGIYLDTSASSGSGQVYNWRFPSGPGTSGQVLSSNGSGTAQSWANVPTISSGNISVNNVFLAFVIITTLPYTMTVSSPAETLITTVSSGNILLPDATTIPAGAAYTFNNNAAGGISIQNASTTTLTTLPVGGFVTMFLTVAGTVAGVWDYHFGIPPNTNWGTSLLSTGSAIKTSSVTEATALNTGALISLGGASISKKLYLGGILSANWDQGVPNGSSAITISPTIGAGQASLAFSTDKNQAGGIWTMGQNVNGAGDETFTLYYAPSTRRLFTFAGLTGALTLGGIIQSTLASSSTTSTTLLSLLQPSAANATAQSISFGVATSTNNQGIIQFNYASSGNGNNAIGFGSPGNLNKMKFFTSLGLLETNTFRLLGITSGAIDLQCPATTSSYSLTFPSTAGSSGQILSTNGTGVTSWISPITPGSAFTTPVTITIASGTIATPALQVSLTAADTNNFYATFLNTAAPNSSNHTICLGHDILDCGYLNYRYVSAASTANYFSIGNSAVTEAFKFYPALQSGSLYCGAINIGSAATNPALTVYTTATATSDLAYFLQQSAANGTSQSMYFGSDLSGNNCGIIRFLYTSAGSSANFLELSTFLGTNKLQIKPTATFAQGLFYTKGIYSANWDQGVPNGSSAITISPTIGAGQASIAFSTDRNFTGGIFTMGQNVNGAGDETFTLYYAPSTRRLFTINGLSGAMTVPVSVSSPQLFTTNIKATGIDLDISTQTTSNGQKIFVHCGGYQTGGIYLNSWNATSSFVPNYGSTNIGNSNLGNSLFVGVQQENYIGVISANGVVNIAASFSNNQFITFYSINTVTNVPTAAIGSITANLAGGVTYNTTSDYRIKQNVQEMPSILQTITQLRPVTFNFLNCDFISHGFLAHEVQEIYPEAVTGEKDAVDEYGKPLLQQLSLANFTPILTKAVQELYQLLISQQQTIADLTARLLIVEQK